MSGTEAHVLAVRTLSALRKLHLPTYVAARFLFDSLAGHSGSAWSLAVPIRKYPMRTVPRFHAAQQFKKIDESDGTIVYRDFLVPSPTTALSEALVLSALSKSPQFKKLDCVYSYRWPRDESYPSSFEHYALGYRRRNNDIAKCLNDRTNCVAVISDIEKFYPSINQATLRTTFRSALAKAELPEGVLTTAAHLMEHLMLQDTDGVGVATGPQMSHVAGDLALQRIDEELSSRFPGAYFRYVDDIVIVAERHEVSKAERILSDLLEDQGLRVHPHKSESITQQEWLGHGPHNNQTIKDTSFEALIFKIKTYLLLHQGQAGALDHALSNVGFSFPIDTWAAAGGSESFSRRFWKLWRRRWWVAVQTFGITQSDIVASALAVRSEVTLEIERMLAHGVPEGVTRRRWHLQRMRYLVNRCVYLLPEVSLEFLVDPLHELAEFAEMSAVLNILLRQDATALLNMPGAAVVAAATKLRRAGRAVGLDDINLKNPAVKESIGILELFGVSKSPKDYLLSLDADSREFIAFCAGGRVEHRMREDFSYLDEIRTLQISRSFEDRIRMIETRFSNDEETVLDALDIGGEQSS